MPATSAGMTISSNRAKPESSSGKRPETAMAQPTTGLPLLPGFDRSKRWCGCRLARRRASPFAALVDLGDRDPDRAVARCRAADDEASIEVRRELDDRRRRPLGRCCYRVLAAAGMLWADVSWRERSAGFSPFHRLLPHSFAAGAVPALRAQAAGSALWLSGLFGTGSAGGPRGRSPWCLASAGAALRVRHSGQGLHLSGRELHHLRVGADRPRLRTRHAPGIVAFGSRCPSPV